MKFSLSSEKRDGNYSTSCRFCPSGGDPFFLIPNPSSKHLPRWIQRGPKGGKSEVEEKSKGAQIRFLAFGAKPINVPGRTSTGLSYLERHENGFEVHAFVYICYFSMDSMGSEVRNGRDKFDLGRLGVARLLAFWPLTLTFPLCFLSSSPTESLNYSEITF